MKNYLKVSVLCITCLTLHGSENRKSGDNPRKVASFAGKPSPKVAVNPLAKSAPIPMKRADVDLGWEPKSPSKPISVNDFLGWHAQDNSPTPRDWRSFR